MILFLVSIAVSLALSTFVGCELGFNSYGPIALIAFVVLFGIFHLNERAHRRGQGLKIETTVGRVAVDLLTQIGLALYLAMTWPSLPLIVWLGRWTRGGERLQAESSGRRS